MLAKAWKSPLRLYLTGRLAAELGDARFDERRLPGRTPGPPRVCIPRARAHVSGADRRAGRCRLGRLDAGGREGDGVERAYAGAGNRAGAARLRGLQEATRG